MRIGAGLLPAVSVALLLSGCGQYLGSYTVESARLTTDVPLAAETSSGYAEFLEVRMASDTSLTSLAENIDGLYVGADYCPLRREDGLIAFGPFGDSGVNLSVPSAAPALRPGPDGRFHYRIYIPVANHAELATEPGQIQLPTYDLRRSRSGVCLRLFAPGYNFP